MITRGIRATGLAMLLIIAACSPTVVEEFHTIETGTTSTIPTTSTTVGPTTTSTTVRVLATPAARQAQAELLLGSDFPEEAWYDWSEWVCEAPSETPLLMAAAEDLVVWVTDAPAEPDTTLAIAHLLWDQAADVCSMAFTEEGLAAGPPTEYQHPECQPLIPHALPWTDEVGEPEVEVVDGVTIATWIGPPYVTFKDGSQTFEELVTYVGRGDTYLATANDGYPLGEMEGQPAGVIGYDGTNSSAADVGWARSDRWCDAVVMRLAPDDYEARGEVELLEYLSSLLYATPSLNAVELLTIDAIDSMVGAEFQGGEPSHGGPFASLAFGLDGHVYWVYVTAGQGDLHAGLGDAIEETVDGDFRAWVYEGEHDFTAVADLFGLGLGVMIGSSTATVDELVETARLFTQALLEESDES